MTSILEFKEKLKEFYARFGVYVDMFIKFIITLTAMLLINKNIGYMEKLNNPFVVIIVSLLCSMLPYGLIAVILGACILAHVYAVSMEMMIILAVLLLVIAILYYGFHPSDAYIIILTPIMFALKLPYVIPLIAGLSAGITSIIPVGCGVLLYYILAFIKNNAGLLTNDSALEITERYKQLLKGIVTNKEMWFLIAAFALTVMIVFLIRQLSVNYSWYMAIAFGVVILLLSAFVGQSLLGIDISVGGVVIQIVISAVIALIYTLIVFNVDYSRTETTQFEDDDYYYYVKAVPKVTVKTSDKKIRKFNDTKNGDARKAD